MKLSLCVCFLMVLGSISSYPQAAPPPVGNPATTPAVAPAAPQAPVPEFYRGPSMNALVILKSRSEVQPNGVTGVSRLVVRDIPILQTKEFQETVAPYLWQPLTEQVMTNLQHDIIRYYRRHDRPLVDVLYPEQNIDNGNLQVVVLEGQLGAVRVQDAKGNPYTNGWSKPEKIRQAVRLQETNYIRESRLLQDLDWLNRNPFRNVVLVYEPDRLRYGWSDVVLRVEERRPISVFVGYEDTGSRITGEDRLLAGLTWGNAFGLRDSVFNYQYTTDTSFDLLRAHTASYAVNLPWRHIFRTFVSYVDVKGSVPNLGDLVGSSYQISMRYEIPLPMIGKYQHAFSLGGDFKSSDNNLLFGVSTNNIPTEVAQVALGYTGLVPDQWGESSFSAQAYYSPGDLTSKNTDAAFSKSHALAKANYFYARFTAERGTKLPFTPGWDNRNVKVNECFSWNLRAAGQIADGNLIASEQLGLGGATTVRGYEEREANEDQGWLISNEIRTPAFSLLKFVGKSNLDDRCQFLGFWDYGQGMPKDPSQNELRRVTFSSVGPGVRYNIGRYFALRFDYGWQLTASGLDDIPGTTTPRQRSRGHVGVQVSF